MSNVYLHLDPSVQQVQKDNNDVDEVDLFNDETFGSGAVEEDWEIDHNNLIQLDFPKLKGEKPTEDISGELDSVSSHQKQGNAHSLNYGPLLSPSHLTDKELELSNQQLAAAVEELVLNSDQDQDAIDPAIVSLRKQSLPSPGTVGSPRFPGFGYNNSNANLSPSLSHAPAPFSDKLHNIWGESYVHGQDHFYATTTPFEGNLLPRLHNKSPPPLEDEAILSAIKADEIPLNIKPVLLKAEDLERELQVSSPRVPSPTYGVRIPESNADDQEESRDRSLPARSISPVFGSPKPSYMPIGTPPKHMIIDMMHQLEQKSKEQQATSGQSPHNVAGGSGSVQHPPPPLLPGMSPRNLPFIVQHGARLPRPVAPGMPLIPPPPAGIPIRPFFSPDIMHRLGLRPQHPAMVSPLGSPGHFAPPRLHANQQGRLRPNALFPPPGIIRPGMQRPMIGFDRDRRRFPVLPVRLGPSHLHPEHSRFVNMRQQRRGRVDRRNNSGQQRNSGFDEVIGVPGDPFANIMTQREKDWVIKIQMLALQSDRPEIDDYYYQNYIERRLRDGKLDMDGSSKAPKRLITPSKPNVDNRKYVPVQFSNSLGKLTASSVYNPRQIIDVVQSAQDDEYNQENTESRQTLSKRLVIYKTIEKAYELVVSMEDLEMKLVVYGDVQLKGREQSQAELSSKLLSIEEVLSLHDQSKFGVHDDPVFQVMKIRKGKKLIARTLPFLQQHHAIIVLQSIFSHLAILIKRDSRDGVLLELYGPMSQVLSTLDLVQLVSLCSLLTTFALTAAIRDQVGVSVICKLLYRGHEESASLRDNKQWNKFVNDLCDVIVTVANPKEGSRHARPSTPSPLLEEFPVGLFEILADQSEHAKSNERLKSSIQRLITCKSI